MRVNVVSESAFTVQGHGVHTAFTETIRALKDYTDCQVFSNASTAADVVHIHTVGPYALAKLLWSVGAKVVSAHVTPDSFVGSLVGAKYWYGLAKWYLRWYYNRADGVLAVSDEVVHELKKMGVTKPVYLVPNTIETQEFKTSPELKAEARRRLHIPPNTFVVIGNGQVQPRKRIDTFVATAKALPEIEFMWVGGVPFKKLAADSREMEEVMQHHPKNVRFTGLVKREDVIDYYRAADLFFLPSVQETFGIVIVEAAAAGLPVLLRDIEQYRLTFEDWYEKGSDSTFTDIIAKFRTDQAYYHKWQLAAIHIAKKYDAKSGAARLMDVYQNVLSIKAGSKAKAEAN